MGKWIQDPILIGVSHPHVELCFGPLFVPKKNIDGFILPMKMPGMRESRARGETRSWGDVLETSTLGFLSNIPKYPDLTPSNSVYKRGHGGKFFFTPVKPIYRVISAIH